MPVRRGLQPDQPVQYIRGVGPVRAQALRELGIQNLHDLLHHFPFRYEQQLGFVPLSELKPDTTVTVRGTIQRIGGRYPGMIIQIFDGEQEGRLRWFQRKHAPRDLGEGVTVEATGKVQLFNELPEIVQPVVRVLADNAPEATGKPELVGVYPATQQIKSATLRRVIIDLLDQPNLPLGDALPPELLRRQGLGPRAAAIKTLHKPQRLDDVEPARRRLAFEELFLLQLALLLRRQQRRGDHRGRVLHLTDEIDRRIRARFPFELTDAQRTVINEITRDLASGQPMTRLLQGDVGSGKTVVALYACLLAVAHGLQAAVMAPTEILAQQHHTKLEQYLAGSRVRRALLRGKQSPSRRRALLDRIRVAEIDLVVGTQALIQDDVLFHKLALVVVDEQHKFGVQQRALLRTKGPRPHALVMTATPIPRTLSMTVFGDLDVSALRGAPPGRGRVTTRLLRGGDFLRQMERLRPKLLEHEQAYVVCPQIDVAEESDNPRRGITAETAAALKTCEKLRNGPWRDVPIGLLHGRLKPDEKAEILAQFKSGALRALVSTTVVEVGVDVPNATLMIIEHAERFGVAQLHQLRGRIGRGTRDGTCLLIARTRNEESLARLNVLCETTDGFRIAEADLAQRGPGELLGTRQHGLPELHAANLGTDAELLLQARDAAAELLARDPALRAREHQALRARLYETYKDRLNLLDAG